MVREVVAWVRPERGGLFLDATLGGGGHAAAILDASSAARLVGVDRDPAAVEAGRGRLAKYGDRVEVVQGNFCDFLEWKERREWPDLAGALLDLGVSSPQIDETARGFSFRPDAPLDMRMGGTTGEGRPAADFLNRASEEELARVFREYGEERRWKLLARRVVQRRRDQPFRVSDDLVAMIRAVVGPRTSAQDKARLFQAVRIQVNDELGALEKGLDAIRVGLARGGLLVAISYHSLEDRIVKRAFRSWSRACVCPPGLPVCRCRGQPLGETLVKRPLGPDPEEVRRNPRARSARLRVWRRW